MITVKNISPMDNVIYMQMKDGEVLICEAMAELDEDKAVLVDIKEYEEGLAYEMGKAILNAIDLKNIKTVLCRNKRLHDTLIKLHFLHLQHCYSLSLEGYFE